MTVKSYWQALKAIVTWFFIAKEKNSWYLLPITVTNIIYPFSKQNLEYISSFPMDYEVLDKLNRLKTIVMKLKAKS